MEFYKKRKVNPHNFFNECNRAITYRENFSMEYLISTTMKAVVVSVSEARRFENIWLYWIHKIPEMMDGRFRFALSVVVTKVITADAMILIPW